MSGVRIGVNALYLIPGGVGGTETYLRCLLSALAEIDTRNSYVVLTNREAASDLIPPAPNFRVAPQPVRATFRPARIVWEQAVLPFTVVGHRIDVLLNPGFTAPLISPCPMVTVFHDLQHKRHPEHFRPLDLPAWRLLLWGAAHRSRLVIAISETTRDDLFRFYDLPPEKVRVVLHGVDDVFFSIGARRSPERVRPFLLTVSTLHPHKNLARLVRAFAEFRKTRPEFELVIAGMRGLFTSELESVIASLGVEDCIRITGWLPRAELRELFVSASAFLYPSSFEGFGLPVLEALAAGVPTGCSAIQPLINIAGEAALTFDPADTAAIRDTMVCLTSDEALRRRLAEAGPRRASAFSWRKTAAETLDALLAARSHTGR